ncbi:MAG: glycosyltransferase, partial [Actinomycetota bacterium]|nr:glycosyltransferase [Actinomycetota bacterium]
PRVTEPQAVAEHHALGEALPLRVGFAGKRGRAFYGGGVQAKGPASEDLDVLVAEPDTDPRAIGSARAAGALVVGRAEGAAGVPGADLQIGAPAEGVMAAAPALDPVVYNPTGFRDSGVAGVAAVLTRVGDGFEQGFGLIAHTAHDEPVTVLAPPGAELPAIPPGASCARFDARTRQPQAVRRAGEHLGVLDHPSFHASELERAGWIAKLCAAGVPVVAAGISDSLAELLGADLCRVLDGLRARDLADLDLRERASVALRRAALRDHSAQARWRQICAAAGIGLPGPPMVSVVFATRRESWLEHGIAQVQRQTYEPRELVVCLHGDDFPAGTSERIRALYDGPLKVLRVAGELTLGDALNAGVEAAQGELVTKMDDDDYYSTEHLWDLVLALEYSQADLVGKAAEFVYLEEIDVTVRQISHDVDTRMAGGGMMARRKELRELGGWPQRSRGEDLALIRRFADAGRPIRRIPPHGYILNRHGVDHTWRPQVDYFLFRSEHQWRGLGFDVTAIEPPADPHTRIP